jgi:hypothetical protein
LILIRLLSFLLISPLFGQIQVDKAGDGWDQKIDSAISLIRETDSAKYSLLESNCSKVSFWVSDFSSNEITPEERGIIYISTKEIGLNSINNLAAVLVHESLHLYLSRKGASFPVEKEENYCYKYELEFIRKLPNPEPWLVQHTQDQIKNTQK